jgi:hypothetical protein
MMKNVPERRISLQGRQWLIGFIRKRSTTKYTFISTQTMTNQSIEPYAMSKLQSCRNFDCKIAMCVK